MAALIALQLRICWRGLPQVMRVAWIFVLIMLVSYFSKKSSGSESLFSLLGLPLVLIPLGALLAIGSADPLIWQVPMRRSMRVWARVVLLAISGATGTAIVASMILSFEGGRPEPLGLLLANLWMSWMCGGLLLCLVGDLVRRSHVIVQALAILASVIPTGAVIMMHLNIGLPWPALAAETVAAVVLLWLSLYVNRDLEFTLTPAAAPATSGPEAVVEPGESCRIAVRVPSLASALLRSQYASGLNWVFVVFWIAASLTPTVFTAVIAGAILMPYFVMRILNVWRPFQATPAPRGKAMAILFLPLFGLWALTLGLQCWSVSYSETSLFTGSLTGFRLPMLTREVPSAELEGRLKNLPPERVAELVRDAYRAGYGLDVSVSEVLALQTQPRNLEGWLLGVDARWAPDVHLKIVEWRLMIGAMVLAWGMLSFVSLLPGRWPRWISGYVFLMGYLLIVVPTFFKGQNSLVSFIPHRLLPIYQTAFDRPWIPITAFLSFAALFLIRNYLVFKSSELAPEPNKAAA